MIDDISPQKIIERVLDQRLRQFQRVIGLPVVFGGAVSTGGGRPELRISRLRGTLGDALRDLRVGAGRGLGGTVLLRGVPFRVDDYASADAITHDFDHPVVQRERLRGIVAFPLRVLGGVGGVVYGAVRGPQPIGDVTLQRAAAFTGSVEREIDALLTAPALRPDERVRTAVDELMEIARTADPELRLRLIRVAENLAGAPVTEPPERRPDPADRRARLAPREIETLRLVALGLSNREVAEALGLSAETVKAYLRSAMRRLEVGNRTGAVHAARSHGLL